MTEKRFIDDGFEAIEDQSFTDTETDKTYYVDYFDEIIDLANGLNEKNKVLHKEIERLKRQNEDILYNNAKNMELLEKENEQLKADNNRLVNETAKVVAEHQRKVFKLIDEKIDELERKYKFGQEVYKGCPMHNIRFGINVLKELKKELQE